MTDFGTCAVNDRFFGSTWKHLEALGEELESGNAVNDRWGVRSMTDGKCGKRPMGGAVIDRRSVTEVWVK